MVFAVIIVTTAAVVTRKCMFTVCVMVARSDVTVPVASFIALKVVKWFGTTSGQRSPVAVMRIISIVDVAVEVIMAVIPPASADEHTIVKPIGTVVAIRRATVRGVIEVTVRANRLWPDIDAK